MLDSDEVVPETGSLPARYGLHPAAAWRRARRGGPVLDSIALLALAAALIWPLFTLRYLNNWGSIESTFIGDARYLREHLPHPAWQPLWYCGTRFDYIYPPALRYGTALLSFAVGGDTARAYHLYTGVFYALGIVGAYWLAWVGSRSRAQAWLAAAFIALLSPSLALVRALHNDSPGMVPQRLHVLMSYGEGPHISSLSILGFALAASFAAMMRGRRAAIALSGILCAAIAANNFYGAVALALFFAILAWSVWLETRRWEVWARAAAIAAIAYGLCAFWLTPSYIRITNENLLWVAEPPTPWRTPLALAFAAAFLAVSFFAARRTRNPAWPVFIFGSACAFSALVLSSYYWNFNVAGNAKRLAPEMDLAMLLVLAFLVTWAWERPRLRVFSLLVLCAALYPAVIYARRAWSIFPPDRAFKSRCEYRITTWIGAHLPGARALSSGSIRFWYDAWRDDAEVYGGSDQGMLDQVLPPANWQILQGSGAEAAILWLQALGADAVIVPDKSSPEIYHDYAYPGKFRGALTEIYNDGRGDAIYRVPRRPGIVRVVDRAALLGIPRPSGGLDMAVLTRYVAAIERGPDAAVSIRRPAAESIDIDASLSAGEAVLLQETFDPAWQAWSDGKRLRIEQDGMGFMVVDAPAGKRAIRMRFEMPLENRLGWMVTALAAAVVAFLLFARRARQ